MSAMVELYASTFIQILARGELNIFDYSYPQDIQMYRTASQMSSCVRGP